MKGYQGPFTTVRVKGIVQQWLHLLYMDGVPLQFLTYFLAVIAQMYIDKVTNFKQLLYFTVQSAWMIITTSSVGFIKFTVICESSSIFHLSFGSSSSLSS